MRPFRFHPNCHKVLNSFARDAWPLASIFPICFNHFMSVCDTSRFIKFKIVAMENIKEENPKPKLPGIKIFQAIQKNFSAIGIAPNSVKQLRPFNVKILINLLTLCVAFIGMLLYIVIEANTFLQFTQSVYMCSTFVIVACAFLVLIFKLNELSKAITDSELIANTSKWGKIFKDEEKRLFFI